MGHNIDYFIFIDIKFLKEQFLLIEPRLNI